jgi:hypothetical protein
MATQNLVFKTPVEAKAAKDYHLATNGLYYDVRETGDGRYYLFEMPKPEKMKFQENPVNNVMQLGDYIKRLEDSGYIVLSKQEQESYQHENIERIVINMLQRQKSKSIDRFYNNIVQPAGIDDLKMMENLRKEPYVQLTITIKRNNLGESMESKRPYTKNNMPIINQWSRKAVLENYIAGSLNCLPFTIGLGPELGQNGCDTVTIFAPRPFAYIIAKARRTAFYDPTLRKMVYPSNMPKFEIPTPQNGPGFSSSPLFELKKAA